MLTDISFLLVLEDYGNEFINTYDGQIVKIGGVDKTMKKNNIRIIECPISDNTFHKYDVQADDGAVCLNVYTGHLKGNRTEWEKVYCAKAYLSHTGIEEEGDCDLSFWHEYFATCFAVKEYDERRVRDYETDDFMKEIRKVFLMELQDNPFLFFEKYRGLKRYKQKDFCKDVFDLPSSKISYAVGKVYNGKVINYVSQHEVEIEGEVFFDMVVLTGPVENGLIIPVEKHRIFLTPGYWYSPDGGDIGVLVEDNTYGVIYDQKMRKKHPELLLDRYHGKYKYQYLLSQWYIPCFELLAKAGYTCMADIMLDSYYSYIDNNNRSNFYSGGWSKINIWGKNDREIFGFKMCKFKNFTEDCFVKYYSARYYRTYDIICIFPEIIKGIRFIIEKNEAALDRCKYIDEDFYDFLECCPDISMRTIDYIQKSGVNWKVYNDYYNMCKQAGLWSGGVYPKNLKHEHDVMIAYTNQMKEITRNTKFVEQVQKESYQSLLYDGDEEDIFCILAPRKAQDLADEGLHLHHCVRSYVFSVSAGTTSIYFLREKERKGASLVTIEVRRNHICQIRGKYNRNPTQQEYKFISKWANEKNLTIMV